MTGITIMCIRNLYGSLHKFEFAKLKKTEFWYGAWYYQIIPFFNQFAFSQQLSAGYMKIN